MAVPTARAIKPKAPPHFRADYDVADAAAVQAVAFGRASEDQQKRAMKWIVEKGCMAYDETFHPESERASTFMQGRRFVGLLLVKFTTASINALKKNANPNAPTSDTGE